MTSTTNTTPPTTETTILLPTDSRGRVKLPKERREALVEEFERSGMSGQEFAKWAWFSRKISSAIIRTGALKEVPSGGRLVAKNRRNFVD